MDIKGGNHADWEITMTATKIQSLAAIKSAMVRASSQMSIAITKEDMTRAWVRAETVKTLGQLWDEINEGASAIDAWKYFCGLETGLRDDAPAVFQAWASTAYAKSEKVSVESLFTPNGFSKIKAFL